MLINIKHGEKKKKNKNVKKKDFSLNVSCLYSIFLVIARYGSDIEDDSDEESEDENAEEWTDDVEKEFLRCYSILKKRDPKIYDSNTTFFNTTSDKQNETMKKPKQKKMNLKDAEIQYALAEAEQNDEDKNHIP